MRRKRLREVVVTGGPMAAPKPAPPKPAPPKPHVPPPPPVEDELLADREPGPAPEAEEAPTKRVVRRRKK